MRFVIALLGVLILGAPVAAHHSVAFYGEQTVELTGRLLDVEFINPHIRLILEAETADGSLETWRMEANSPYNLRRAGITPERFPIGQMVRITGNESTRQERRLLATSMVLPDGQELELWFVNQKFRDSERLVAANDEERGIFRVWTVPADNLEAALLQLEHQPFTDEAIAARAAWDMLDNFATRCEPEGMPRIMLNPHPFEFVDHGSTYTLRTELYDIERTIHMDRDAPPEDEPRSRLGYSIGSWEGDTLVVRTTRINWPYFDNIGTPQSTDVQIEERFTLSNDQSRLDFEITVTDPAAFTRPAVLTGYWLALGDTIPRYDCVPLGQ